MRVTLVFVWLFFLCLPGAPARQLAVVREAIED